MELVTPGPKAPSIQLVDRTCGLDGCKTSYKVMAHSLQMYCCVIHAAEDDHKLQPIIQKKNKPWESYKKEVESPSRPLSVNEEIESEMIKASKSIIKKKGPLFLVNGPPKATKKKAKDKKLLKPRGSSRVKKKVTSKSKSAKAKKVQKCKSPKLLPNLTTHYARQKTNESKWAEYVNRAKTFVKKMNYNRMQVAQLALDACDIEWGGGSHWSDWEGKRTLKNFAEEVGVQYKTLHRWVGLKRDIIDKLPEGLYEEEKFSVLQATKNKIKRNTPRERVSELYELELSRTGDLFILAQFIKRCKTGRYFICEKANLKKLPKDELLELDQLMGDVRSQLNKEIKRRK